MFLPTGLGKLAAKLGITQVVKALARGRGASATRELLPSSKQLAKFDRQLTEHGRGSVEKSQRTIERRLEEHVGKLGSIQRAGGHTSSVEREIRNYLRELEAIRRVLTRSK